MLIETGTTTVSTAGTEVQLSATASKVRWIEFTGARKNKGPIYIGKSAISSGDPITYIGKKIARREIWTMEIGSLGASADSYVELNTIYVDAEESGESVHWIAIIDAS